MSDAANNVVVLARRLANEGLASDPFSMYYHEVKVRMNVQELHDIAQGIEEARDRRNEAEMVILELLHILAAPHPHAALVEQTLSGETNAFERGKALLGVDMALVGTIGANNG